MSAQTWDRLQVVCKEIAAAPRKKPAPTQPTRVGVKRLSGEIYRDTRIPDGQVDFEKMTGSVQAYMNEATYASLADRVGISDKYIFQRGIAATKLKNPGDTLRAVVQPASYYEKKKPAGVQVTTGANVEASVQALVRNMVSVTQERQDCTPKQLEGFTAQYAALNQKIREMEDQALKLRGMLDIAGAQLREFNE